MKKWIILFLIVMNLVCFFLYWLDKRKAQKGRWRISEACLLILPFLGGGICAWLGMKCFHHKTQHTRFKILVPIAALINLAEIILTLVFL